MWNLQRNKGMMWVNKSIKGRYTPKNASKYDGDIEKITYRSMWERRFMLYCDKSDQIVTWSSEELHIPYIATKKDRVRNYYPDFVVETCDGKTIIVEIKPYSQKRMQINLDKWKAARRYCRGKNIEFMVLTERELF